MRLELLVLSFKGSAWLKVKFETRAWLRLGSTLDLKPELYSDSAQKLNYVLNTLILLVPFIFKGLFTKGLELV